MSDNPPINQPNQGEKMKTLCQICGSSSPHIHPGKILALIAVLLSLWSATVVFGQEGTLQVIHKEKPGRSEISYYLQTNTEQVELKKVHGQRWLTGDKVKVSGKRVNGTIEVATMETVALAALPNSTGPRKTVVILVNFYNGPTNLPHFNPLSIRQNFDQVSGFYRANSFDHTWLVGVADPTATTDVYEFTSPDLSYGTCENAVNASAQARDALANARVSLSEFAHVVHIFPQVDCWWSGLAFIGGVISYINGSEHPGLSALITHELGHNLGLYHSHSLTYVNDVSNYSEYGDSFDVMGNIGGFGHFNAGQKELLGWLNLIDQNYRAKPKPARGKKPRAGGSFPPLINVTRADGLHFVGPYENNNLDVKALKIAGAFYVEHRTGATGVLVHFDDSGDGNYLLDVDNGEGQDFILDVGQVFSRGGVTITPLSVDSLGATVHVRTE